QISGRHAARVARRFAALSRAALASRARQQEFPRCVPLDNLERSTLVRRILLVATFLLPLLFALPTAGQRSESYFALSTEKTFLPGDKTTIRLNAWGVSALEFRIYKVNDPVRFFEKLDDVHSFGQATPPEKVDSPTLLERFHDWKRNIWRRTRNLFRSQFSSPSRALARQVQNAAKKPDVGGAAAFAQVPLLNSSQLVARWSQEMPSHAVYKMEPIPGNALPKGVYLVEATDGNLRAYTILIVSELGLVTKEASGQILALAADRRTGAPISQVPIHIWWNKAQVTDLTSDANGLAEFSLPHGP